MSRLPFWHQAVGAENFGHDWEVGDIVVHSTDDLNGQGNGPANVAWTSPISGPIDIAGGVWMGRDIGRSNLWSLWLNNTLLTSGAIFSGDPFDRAHPYDLATGSGGAAVLQDLVVSLGDVVVLQLDTTSLFGDFVRVSLTVSITQLLGVPEIGIEQSGQQVVVHFNGLLQTSADLLEWEDLTPQPCSPWMFVTSFPQMFFRAREE